MARAPLAGRVAAGDALQTQREVCEQVVAAGVDYLLPIKANQPALGADLAHAFSPSRRGRPARS